MGRPTNQELADLKDHLDSLISGAEQVLDKLQEEETAYSNAISTIETSLQSATSDRDAINTLLVEANQICDDTKTLKETSVLDMESISEFSQKKWGQSTFFSNIRALEYKQYMCSDPN